jgi:type VI secretion system protein ImpL
LENLLFMKLIYKLKPYTKYLLLLPLAILALLIWHYGPHLILAHHFPLREPQKRLALILALFLAWAAKYLLWDQITPTSSDNLNLTQLLHALRGRFLGALRFLKKTTIDKHGFSTPLNKLPWYLLIGPPGSGKTTLLTQSNINFILSKQKKQENQEKAVASSSVCDWWVTRDLVLVDVPGCYTFSPPRDQATDALRSEEEKSTSSSKPHAHLVLWQNLLNLLIKYRQKNNVGAIVIALNLPELIKLSRHQQNQWFQELKQRLVECFAKFGKLPIYFLITKCDLLPGFSEFFNDIGSDELMQPWGIPLSGRKEHEKLLDLFTDRFNALIRRLNKQLIWRLHQERNPQLRPLIKDFPLQLEFMKETLSHLIKMLTATQPDLELEGIYLSSATQENMAAQSATLFHHDVPSALEVLQPSPFISRAYFIKHVISYLLPHTSQHLVQRFRHKRPAFPQLAYGLGLVLLLIGVFGLGKDFQRGLYQLSSVQRYLAQYQLYLQQNNTQDASLTTLATASRHPNKYSHLAPRTNRNPLFHSIPTYGFCYLS